ncbi:MAG: hypothetical protein M1449_12395, partial [Candidatus Thermoplasmatota archaeon]|nr:hypothetical protein [Candidatus Thermoplasmatota archaeon]
MYLGWGCWGSWRVYHWCGTGWCTWRIYWDTNGLWGRLCRWLSSPRFSQPRRLLGSRCDYRLYCQPYAAEPDQYHIQSGGTSWSSQAHQLYAGCWVSRRHFRRAGAGKPCAQSRGCGGQCDCFADCTNHKGGGNKTQSAGAAIPQYGYTGREPDGTGLIYYRARYYDPTLGRFI